MKLAGLSIDVDSVASHLQGYGFERPEDDGKAYSVAIPRALDLFERHGARCTFFLIAEEAAQYPEVVREITRKGHEVASHSMTHKLPFTNLSDQRRAQEVQDSKTVLEALCGERVTGFRAPSWDISPDLFDALVDAGYRYDASTYPSFLLPLLRLSVARRSSTGKSKTESSLFAGVFGPTKVHHRKNNGRQLVEVPICTAPFTRLPYYHTLRFLLPSPAFRGLERLTQTRRGPITYQFHAVDFMGVNEDGLDARIDRHPGMSEDLETKLALAERAVEALTSKRHVVPLAEIVSDTFAPTPESATTT